MEVAVGPREDHAHTLIVFANVYFWTDAVMDSVTGSLINILHLLPPSLSPSLSFRLSLSPCAPVSVLPARLPAIHCLSPVCVCVPLSPCLLVCLSVFQSSTPLSRSDCLFACLLCVSCLWCPVCTSFPLPHIRHTLRNQQKKSGLS